MPKGGETGCFGCMPGNYSAATGLTAPCPGVCPAGTFAPQGSASCRVCPEKTFNPLATGVGACEDCPTGKFHTPVRTLCIDCVAGEFVSSASACEACPGEGSVN